MNKSRNHESANTSGTRLHYGPDVLRLIESPEFRAHFEPDASLATSTREQGPAGRALDLGGSGVAEGTLQAVG